ncbi:response regulator [bacterium]|nr:response regulator [bacterium]
MKKTIQSKLAGYSILLILLTTISVITGAIVLQMYQTNQDNQDRLLRTTEIFHKDFEAKLKSLQSDWQIYTSDADRTNRFMLPLMFAPYITYIPKQLHNFAKQYDAKEIALYLPNNRNQRDQLYAYYNSTFAGVILLPSEGEENEKLLFEWDREGYLRQKSTDLTPDFPETYNHSLPNFTLETKNNYLTLLSQLQYVNTTFEDFSMGVTNGSHIGYLVLRTPLQDFIKSMEYRLGVSFSLFDIHKKGGLESVKFGSLPGQDNHPTNQMFGYPDESGNSHDILVSPIKYEEKTIGYLVASISQAEFYHRLKTTVIVLLLTALLVVLISFLFSWRYVKRISNPLKKLAQSFESYTSQKKLAAKSVTQSLESVQSNSSFLKVSEFKNLITSFRRMLGFIEEQTAIIESQNLSLENQIEVIEQKNLELQEINRLKDDFLASTSHELRTPLHGIIGVAEVMLSVDVISRSDEEKRHLSMIISNGRRLSNLLNDLLDFYRLKNHAVQLNKIPVKLSGIVEAVLTFSKPLIGNRSIDLINDVADSLPPVEADKNKLEQIFYNLLSNSLKFTQEGFIKVAGALAGDSIKIMVEDSGIGISPDKLETIFDVFTQLDGSITREQPGTGLGLSITKKLVEGHGSQLHVKSEPEVGTVFHFDLPISQDEAHSSDNPNSATENLSVFGERLIDTGSVSIVDLCQTGIAPAKIGNHSILVVDDDPVNLEILRASLGNFGYNVRLVENGFKALEAMESELPDLILLDLMMPRMSGFELCETIRRKWDIITLPIIVLTAKNQLKDLEKGFQLGANDYLTKPFHPREIIARVRTHLMAREAVIHLQENQRLLEEISRRKQLENDLLRSQKQLISILNVEEDAIVCLNRINSVVFFNQGAERIFGMRANDIIGDPATDLFPLLELQYDTHVTDGVENKRHTLIDIKLNDDTETKAISYISRFIVDDEILTTIILPRQNSETNQFDFIQSSQDKLQIKGINESKLAEQLNAMGNNLTVQQQKIHTLEKALSGVVNAISLASGFSIRNDFPGGNQIPDVLDAADSGGENIRKLILTIMTTSLECWENSTGKSKIDLAQESGIWSVQLDNGTYKTRTLNKYLKYKTIPRNPRFNSIISTANFVINNCEINQSQQHLLESSVSLLKESIAISN